MKTVNLFNALNEIVDLYKKDNGIYAIILRGSLSRGDHDVYSDIDLTFIIDKNFNKINPGMGRTKSGVDYGFRFIEKDAFYNQEWTISMRHAYQFSKILYSKLEDLEKLIMKKCIWREDERIKYLVKHVIDAQFCFPFFNIDRKMIPSEFIKAGKRGFHALSIINLIESIENLCSILCVLNGVFPPEKKLYWTRWFENCIDYIPSGFSLAKLEQREKLILEFKKEIVDENLIITLKENYTAIDNAIKEVWYDYEFDYYEFFLNPMQIKRSSKKDKYTAKIDAVMFDYIDKRVVSTLDLGCGNGRHIKRLRDIGSRKIVGVDKSKEDLTLAKKRGMGKCIEIDLNKLDKTSIEGEFDLIIISAVFSYLDDSTIEKNLNLLSSKLNKDGFILFTDFIFDADRKDYIYEDSVAKLNLKKEGLCVYHRNLNQLKNLFEGFKIIKVLEDKCITFNDDYHPYVQILFKR